MAEYVNVDLGGGRSINLRMQEGRTIGKYSQLDDAIMQSAAGQPYHLRARLQNKLSSKQFRLDTARELNINYDPEANFGTNVPVTEVRQKYQVVRQEGKIVGTLAQPERSYEERQGAAAYERQKQEIISQEQERIKQDFPEYIENRRQGVEYVEPQKAPVGYVEPVQDRSLYEKLSVSAQKLAFQSEYRGKKYLIPAAAGAQLASNLVGIASHPVQTLKSTVSPKAWYDTIQDLGAKAAAGDPRLIGDVATYWVLGKAGKAVTERVGVVAEKYRAPEVRMSGLTTNRMLTAEGITDVSNIRAEIVKGKARYDVIGKSVERWLPNEKAVLSKLDADYAIRQIAPDKSLKQVYTAQARGLSRTTMSEGASIKVMDIDTQLNLGNKKAASFLKDITKVTPSDVIETYKGRRSPNYFDPKLTKTDYGYSLKIGKRRFSVIEKRLAKDTLGEFNPNTEQIFLKRGLPREQALNTALHEAGHKLYYEAEIGKLKATKGLQKVSKAERRLIKNYVTETYGKGVYEKPDLLEEGAADAMTGYFKNMPLDRTPGLKSNLDAYFRNPRYLGDFKRQVVDIRRVKTMEGVQFTFDYGIKQYKKKAPVFNPDPARARLMAAGTFESRLNVELTGPGGKVELWRTRALTTQQKVPGKLKLSPDEMRLFSEDTNLKKLFKNKRGGLGPETDTFLKIGREPGEIVQSYPRGQIESIARMLEPKFKGIPISVLKPQLDVRAEQRAITGGAVPSFGPQRNIQESISRNITRQISRPFQVSMYRSLQRNIQRTSQRQLQRTIQRPIERPVDITGGGSSFTFYNPPPSPPPLIFDFPPTGKRPKRGKSSFFGLNIKPQYAASLKAIDLGIFAPKGFKPDKFVGSGLFVRPLVR